MWNLFGSSILVILSNREIIKKDTDVNTESYKSQFGGQKLQDSVLQTGKGRFSRRNKPWHVNSNNVAFLTSVDSDEPVQLPWSLETPNGVQSVA